MAQDRLKGRRLLCHFQPIRMHLHENRSNSRAIPALASVLRLQEVLPQQGELIELRARGTHTQELFGGRERQRSHLAATLLHAQRLRLPIELLHLVALLVDADEAVVAADDEALGEGDHAGGRPGLPGAAGQHQLELARVVEEQQVAVVGPHEHLVVVQPTMTSHYL